MKVNFEASDDYVIYLEPETKEEAVALVRFGLNYTKELKCVQVSVWPGETLSAAICIGRAKNETSLVGRSK